MADKETISVYDSQVENYLGLINKQPIDELLLGFIEDVQSKGYVLDLGCGPAISSATMREHGLRVDPVDASIEMVKLANSTFDIGARQAVFDDIDVENTYDGVWANFSLLHASADELPGILEKLHHALKPGGILHMGMKIGKGAIRDKFGRYYTYYSREELTDHIATAGFSIGKVELGEGMGLAGELEPWIAITSYAVDGA